MTELDVDALPEDECIICGKKMYWDRKLRMYRCETCDADEWDLD